VKTPHDIIIAPYITEKSMGMSYGDMRIKDENELVRKYTFLVDADANKIEIKSAIEAIYNAGKKDADKITVEKVHTIRILGKMKRVRTKATAYPKAGRRPDRKKAIITLGKGQMLEDYGV
jgi:large subunit ribosomal protein L23